MTDDDKRAEVAGPSLRRTEWPRSGASAAIFRGRDVLLIQRGKGTFTGLWSLPGGHIEPGETARHAAAREVLEETGVEAAIKGVLDVHDVIMRDGAGALKVHYVISVFWGVWLTGEAVAGSDSRAARFFPLGDLPSTPMTEGAMNLIERASQLALGPAE